MYAFKITCWALILQYLMGVHEPWGAARLSLLSSRKLMYCSTLVSSGQPHAEHHPYQGMVLADKLNSIFSQFYHLSCALWEKGLCFVDSVGVVQQAHD